MAPRFRFLTLGAYGEPKTVPIHSVTDVSVERDEINSQELNAVLVVVLRYLDQSTECSQRFADRRTRNQANALARWIKEAIGLEEFVEETVGS